MRVFYHISTILIIMCFFFLQTFIKRFRKIMDSSQHSAHQDASFLTSKLDHIERQVFLAGRIGVKDFLQWEAGNTAKLTTSETVVNHKKRKRSMLEWQSQNGEQNSQTHWMFTLRELVYRAQGRQMPSRHLVAWFYRESSYGYSFCWGQFPSL